MPEPIQPTEAQIEQINQIIRDVFPEVNLFNTKTSFIANLLFKKKDRSRVISMLRRIKKEV